MTNDSEFRPMPGEENILELRLALGQIGTEHIHVTDVTTFAAEAFTNEGTDHQTAIVLEVAGRYNRTTTTGTAKLICSLEAAVQITEHLTHAIKTAIANGATLGPTDG